MVRQPPKTKEYAQTLCACTGEKNLPLRLWILFFKHLFKVQKSLLSYEEYELPMIAIALALEHSSLSRWYFVSVHLYTSEYERERRRTMSPPATVEPPPKIQCVLLLHAWHCAPSPPLRHHPPCPYVLMSVYPSARPSIRPYP